tara:strand:+ start:79 stop:459 length:381 start_codon:yes stop_codon:yes gene_type:complete
MPSRIWQSSSQRGQIVYTVSGALEVGTDLAFPFQPSGEFTITEVFIICKAAPTGAAIIVDVNLNGVTIFTDQANRPTIADGALTGTSGTPDVIKLAKNDSLTIDVDQVGSGDTGEDMTIQIRGTQP